MGVDSKEIGKLHKVSLCSPVRLRRTDNTSMPAEIETKSTKAAGLSQHHLIWFDTRDDPQVHFVKGYMHPVQSKLRNVLEYMPPK